MQVKKAGRKLQPLEAFSPRDLIKAEECWSQNNWEKCPLICSFGFNFGGGHRAAPACFISASFWRLSLGSSPPLPTPSPPGVCEFQGQLKVKLYHVGDEMQADVAGWADGGHTLRTMLSPVGAAWQNEQSLIAYNPGFPSCRFGFQSEGQSCVCLPRGFERSDAGLDRYGCLTPLARD